MEFKALRKIILVVIPDQCSTNTGLKPKLWIWVCITVYVGLLFRLNRIVHLSKFTMYNDYKSFFSLYISIFLVQISPVVCAQNPKLILFLIRDFEFLFAYHRCQCPAQFEGPECQQTKHSFHGNGYAWFPPIRPCFESHLSLEFITEVADGLLLYSGPLSQLQPWEPEDFMAIGNLHTPSPQPSRRSRGEGCGYCKCAAALRQNIALVSTSFFHITS